MKYPIAIAAFLLAVLLAQSLNAQTKTPPYDGSWESLQKMPVPAWFDDGKIGIFIHWGPYSAIGYRKGRRGYAEHVPKMIYADSKHYYPYMQDRWGATPPEFGYKDIIPEFKAEKWNPDQWAKLFSEVGAKYVVLTAEHHDGWANWDSDLTPWNAVDKGPHRDLVGDLGKAVRKLGLKYAPSYHRERHSSFFAKKLYVVDAEAQPDILKEIELVPEAASLYGPFGFSKEYVDDYVARWKEIQTKYQPDFLWLDDFPIFTRDGNKVRKGKAKPKIKYLDDQLLGMITDFMNDAAERGQPVYCNNKGGNLNWPAGVGCREKDNLKLKVIGPKWQSCTTFGSSFGYLEGDKYKTVESVIHEMVEVISRNGNFLINIGPKGDGTLVPEQVERLRAMGDWLEINGDAIYGSRYWKVFDQKDEHLAFTTNGKKLYAIKLAKPDSPFTITGTADWKGENVKSVKLLGSSAEVKWEMTSKGLKVSPPEDLGTSQHAWSFEIVTDRQQHHANVIGDAPKALGNKKTATLLDNDPNDSFDMSFWEAEGVDPRHGDTMVFDALREKRVTPNGNGWRHELKIKVPQRVGMTEIYEDFEARVKVDMSSGGKTIVAQHHAGDTGTIVKLYVADTKEKRLIDSRPNNGVFDVYVRLAREDGSGEEKRALGTIKTGDSFNLRITNDKGMVTVSAFDKTFSLRVRDSSKSYLKFGNYLQAQDPYTNRKVKSKKGWAKFYRDAKITTSVMTFSNIKHVRRPATQ